MGKEAGTFYLIVQKNPILPGQKEAEPPEGSSAEGSMPMQKGPQMALKAF
jgi:hypothetical protein